MAIDSIRSAAARVAGGTTPPRFRPWLALRLAWRGLRRDRPTTLTAVVTLGLGLAAPATFFSLLVGAVRPLPVPDGERVVRVDVVQPRTDGGDLAVRSADLEAWAGAHSVAGVGGFRIRAGTLVDPGTAATSLALAEMSSGVLPLLRVSPVLGRVPDPSEADGSVLLGHDIWEEVLGGDPGVVGRTVELDGRPRTIAGVMPEGFAFPFRQDAWVILPEGAQADDAPLEPVARLADGATQDAAAVELQGLWRRRDPLRQPEDRGGVVRVARYTSGRGEAGEAAPFVGLVLVAVCLLLIACANVANLLLVRATERVRMLGVQAALGAGRLQLGGQLLLEALLLAAGGGLVGLVLAHEAVDYVQRTAGPENFGYYWMRMTVDGRVVAFTAALVTVTALVAGLVPVVRVLRADLQRTLKDPAASGAVEGGGRIGRAFVSAQLALSCGALVAAVLTSHTMRIARDLGSGLPAREVLVATADLEAPGRVTPGPGEAVPVAAPGAGVSERAVRILDAVQRAPGVRRAALALGAPAVGAQWGPVEEEGVTYEGGAEAARVMANAVTADYFRVLDLDVLAGRALTAADGPGAPRVAVVNASFVRRFSPGRDVLGRRFRVLAVDSSWVTVVGVVEDPGLGAGPLSREDRIYLSLLQLDAGAPTILLRTAGGSVTDASGALRQAVAGVDPRIPLGRVRTLDDLLRFMTRAQATLGFLGASGGFAALLVAVVGLYGLLAFRVRRRRRELGVRMALGADGARLAREVLGSALRQILPATAVGLALAWLVAPLLAVILLGSDPRDPRVYAVVAVTFTTCGALAALLPALRAAATDPAGALHGE